MSSNNNPIGHVLGMIGREKKHSRYLRQFLGSTTNSPFLRDKQAYKKLIILTEK
jgi:hypothetical protein